MIGTESQSPRNIPELTGLRGVAILLVLVWHYYFGSLITGGASIEEGSLLAFVVAPGLLAWSGVDLFFVLSGFLLGGILLDSRGSSTYFKTFYLRRFFRIVPLYLTVLTLVWASVALGIAFVPVRSLDVPWYSYITFTQNFWMTFNGFDGNFLKVTWSLAVEEQFYLTLPLLIAFVKPSRLKYVLAAIVVLAPFLRVFAYSVWPGGWLGPYMLGPCRADALALGVIGALIVRSPEAKSVLSRKRWLVVPMMCGFGVLYVFSLNGWNFNTLPMLSIGYTMLALFYLCLLLYVVLHGGSFAARIMRWNWLMKLGVIAYGAYLLHLPAVSASRWLWRTLEVPSGPIVFEVGSLAVAFALTVTVASFSWRCFEKPLVKLGHRYKYRESLAKMHGSGYSEVPKESVNVLAETGEDADREKQSGQK